MGHAQRTHTQTHTLAHQQRQVSRAIALRQILNRMLWAVFCIMLPLKPMPACIEVMVLVLRWLRRLNVLLRLIRFRKLRNYAVSDGKCGSGRWRRRQQERQERAMWRSGGWILTFVLLLYCKAGIEHWAWSMCARLRLCMSRKLSLNYKIRIESPWWNGSASSTELRQCK